MKSNNLSYIVLFSIVLIFSCSGSTYKFQYERDIKPKFIKFPEVKFAVISDLHYYDKSLGVTGSAFKDYIENDRKLLVESEELLNKALDMISKEDVDFLIVPGDLTKDGEKINHLKVSEKLKKFKESGKIVFVINGNHDLNSGHSYRYDGDKVEKVETTSKDEFIDFYYEVCYRDAIDRDSESLSYLVEPKDGLWVLLMDSCLWNRNDINNEPIVKGEFGDSTLAWIESVLIKAQKEKKAVIGVMHHGILEHYNSNKKFYGAYVVNFNDEIAKMFSHYRMNYIFTGHFHSQDITKKEYNNGDYIYDIETGSIVTYPCPYRVVSITAEQKMIISSKVIEEIDSIKDFHSYSYKYVFEGTIKMAEKKLKKFGVPNKDISNIATQVAYAYTAHLAGDEKPKKDIVSFKGLSLWSRIVVLLQKDLIEGWSNDLYPEDNNLTIKLDR